MWKYVILQFFMKFELNNLEKRYFIDKLCQDTPSETVTKMMNFFCRSVVVPKSLIKP